MIKGEASLFLELKNGYIKMYHGTEKVLLFSKIAENNKTWSKIDKSKKLQLLLNFISSVIVHVSNGNEKKSIKSSRFPQNK